MNPVEQTRAAEAARDETSRQRYRRVLKEDLEYTLTLVVGEPTRAKSSWRWRCFLGNHGPTLSVVLPAVAGDPVIVCDRGCDSALLADVLDILNRHRQQEEHRKMVEARRKGTVQNPHSTNIMRGGGRSRVAPGAEPPVSRPGSAATNRDSTTGGAK